MSLFTDLPSCNDLQLGLETVYNAENRAQAEMLPALSFISSYSSPMRPVIAPGSGKVLGVEVEFRQPLTEGAVSEVSERGCIATRQPALGTALYDIDPDDILSVNTIIEATKVRGWCGNNADLFAAEISNMFDALAQKVATRCAEDSVLLAGDWNTETKATFTVNVNEALVLNTRLSGGAINPEMSVDLDFALRSQQDYRGDYVVIGDETNRYYRLAQEGCCAASGLQLDAIFARFGYAAIADRRFRAELASLAGAPSALVVQAGAIQMLNYVQADWSTGIPILDDRSASYASMVVVHPTYGFAAELTVKDECRGKVHLIMDTVVKFVGPPTSMYRPDDYRAGNTFINKLKITNP